MEEGCEPSSLIEPKHLISSLAPTASALPSANRFLTTPRGAPRLFGIPTITRGDTRRFASVGRPGTASDLNWGCRNKTLDLGMDALPTKEGEMVAVLLVKPTSPTYQQMEGLQTGRGEGLLIISSAAARAVHA